jgi:hypothetical protein
VSNTVTTDPNEKKSSWRDKTLKAAGLGYMLGDIGLFAAALARGKATGKNAKISDELKSSAVWFAGGIAAARYGNPKENRQIAMQAADMQEFFKKNGIKIPTNLDSENPLLQKPSFFKKCGHFLYKHPSEMLNGMFGVGAALLVKQGIQEVKKNKNMFSTLGMGIAVGLGALSGLLIKEDADARKKARDGNFVDQALAYIKEKPLRLTGTLYATNNIFTVRKALGDWKNFGDKPLSLKPHYFSTAAATVYILSNISLFFSRREQTSKKGFSPEGIAKLEDAAARVIAAQPLAKQKALGADVAHYLSQQHGISSHAEAIEAHLAERVAALSKPVLSVFESPAPTQFAAKEITRRAVASEQEAALNV